VLADSLVFVLPDGRSSQVAARAARLICDRLWDLGITPGAATAAARISDALHSHPTMRGDVNFTEREVAPLMDASNLDPLTWTRLVGSNAPATLSRARSQQLLDTCVELIDSLKAEGHHDKLRALIADLERIRDNLTRSGQARDGD